MTRRVRAILRIQAELERCPLQKVIHKRSSVSTHLLDKLDNPYELAGLSFLWSAVLTMGPVAREVLKLALHVPKLNFSITQSASPFRQD